MGAGIAACDISRGSSLVLGLVSVAALVALACTRLAMDAGEAVRCPTEKRYLEVRLQRGLADAAGRATGRAGCRDKRKRRHSEERAMDGGRRPPWRGAWRAHGTARVAVSLVPGVHCSCAARPSRLAPATIRTRQPGVCSSAPTPPPPARARAAQAPRPPVARMSYPGSGNTWVRHVIETLTGYHTGSVYRAERLFDVFAAEGDGKDSYDRLIAVKTHKLHKCEEWPRAVLVVRHPLHAILSEYQRQRTGLNKTAGVDPDEWDWDDWRDAAGAMCSHWAGMHAMVLGEPGAADGKGSGKGGKGGKCMRKGEYTVFFYEDMTLPSGELNPHFLRALLDLFGIDDADAYAGCAIANSRGSYKRVVPADHPSRLALKDEATLAVMRRKGCVAAYEEYRRRFGGLPRTP